jgi:membrane protein
LPDNNIEKAPVARHFGENAAAVGWIWRDSIPEESAFSRIVRDLARIAYITLREFQRDSITLRASALTYTVVLSMVPILALGTAILKGMGAGNQIRQVAYNLINTLETTQEGHAAIQSEAGKSPPAPEAEEPGKEPPAQTLTANLRKAVDTVFDYVDRTNFAALGAFGILGVLFTVISVLGSIEEAMNVIWQAESGRPLGRKIMDYMALTILLPVTLNVALAAMAALQSNKLLGRIQQLLPMDWAGPWLIELFTLAVVVGTFTTLYKFLPNTRVGTLPAAIGGFVGGLAWLIVQAVYVKLQIGVANYNAIYGSFAFGPLFLLWIYMGWVTFLSGAEVAFAVRVRRHYLHHGGDSATPAARLALAFDVLAETVTDFSKRRITECSSLAKRLGETEAHVDMVLKDLDAGGLLRHIEHRKKCYVPSTSADGIDAAEVVEMILGDDVPPSRGGRAAKEAVLGAKAALASKKISTLTQDD